MMEDPLLDADLRRRLLGDAQGRRPEHESEGRARRRSGPSSGPSRWSLWVWIVLLTAGFVAVVAVLAGG